MPRTAYLQALAVGERRPPRGSLRCVLLWFGVAVAIAILIPLFLVYWPVILRVLVRLFG